MQYIGNVIRPPSEANSIILQVAVGCSYNKCTFCGAYKDTPFSLKSPETILEDLQFAATHMTRQKRIFLADGDALILSQKKLLWLLDNIREKLPWVRRVSLYANARAVRSKTTENLLELKAKGLNRVYMGLESGSDVVLEAVRKGENSQSMLEAGRKIKETGFFLSMTALLGLGGTNLSELHAKETGKLLKQITPNQIALLTLMPLAGTPLGDDVDSGLFILPEPDMILRELKMILHELSGVKCQFHANHASSYLPLSGRLPKDRETLLSLVEQALSGAICLSPESRRAL